MSSAQSVDGLRHLDSDETQELIAYLVDAAPEQEYFLSKHIADEVTLNAKQIGHRLKDLSRFEVLRSHGLKLTKWGGSNGTTWHITEVEG